MSNEELEFSISQYLDGSLSAAETTALEARLGEDVAARALLDEYRALNGLLTAEACLPPIAWDKLADHLSSAVAEDAEHVEFAISQYGDGTLATEQVPEAQALLKENAQARRYLAQDRALTGLLKTAPLPAIRWEELASHLSEVVADAAEPRSIKLFASPWIRGIGALAMAACILVATSLGIRHFHQKDNGGTALVKVTPNDGGAPPADQPRITIVTIGGPEMDQPQGTSVAEIAIEAGSDTPNSALPSFAEGIVTRAPRSLIATAPPAAQDNGQMPY